MTIDHNDKFYPDANEWMWNYCIFLGKFTNSQGIEYDLGVYIDEDGEPSGAIVAGNTPGDYYSGELEFYMPENFKGCSNEEQVIDRLNRPNAEKYLETIRRARILKLIK